MAFNNIYHVASRKFLCCLPVRLGVFVLSFLSAVFGGIVSAAVWYIVVRTAKYGTVDASMSNTNITITNVNSTTGIENALDNVALDKSQYYAYIVIGIVYSLYTLFSLFGFFGAIVRKRSLVAFYSTTLWILLLVNLALGIYQSKTAVDRESTLKAQCDASHASSSSGIVGTTENKVTNVACDAESKANAAVTIIVFVFWWLIQLYCCVIVKRYVEQLSEEQGFRQYAAGNKVAKGQEVVGSYYPHQPLGSQVELMPAPGPYPYAQPDHSFGAKV